MEGLFSLLSVSEYQGYKVKEWSIVQFSKLGPVLSAIAKEYQESKMDWSKFASAIQGSSESGMLDMTTGMLDTLQPFVKHAPIILSVSCGMNASQLDEMKYTDGIVLLLLVLKTNIEHLNGFFVKLAAQKPEATTASI